MEDPFLLFITTNLGTITVGKTWTDAENVNYTDLNGNFSTIYNEFNGSISNDNIDASAAIEESKISFNTSTGHDHDGTDSKAIPKAIVFTVTGTLTTGTSVAPVLLSTGSLTISKAYVNVKTAPSGADLIVDIDKSSDNGSTWTSIWNTNQANRVKVADGSTSGTETSFDTTSLSESDLLRLNIDQVGSTTAGADLTVTVKT